MTDLGPFDLSGAAFLKLYVILLTVAIAASFAIAFWLRPEGRETAARDADDFAYLNGGVLRLVDTVVARLLASGAMRIDKVGKSPPRFITSPARAHEVGAIFGPGGAPTSWAELARGAIRRHAEAIEARLVRAELLMPRGTALGLRLLSTLPLFLLILFGAVKWQIGIVRDKPVGYLTGLLIATAVIALWRWNAVDQRTRGGFAVVREARHRLERISRAPTTDETAMAVALFGTAVLAGSALAVYHQFRTNASSDGGGGAGDGDGGGGGCGGCGS